MSEPLKNGNGKLNVPLGWIQFFVLIATLIGGFLLSAKVQEVRAEFQHVEVLKETKRNAEQVDKLEERVYNLELVLTGNGIDIRRPAITITRRRNDEGDEDARQ